MIPELEVLLHGERVGSITESERARLQFRFFESYGKRSERPVLGQKFEDALERAYLGKEPLELPPFFENLIPEGDLRPLLEEALSVPLGDDAALLLALGRDLPGAVEVRSLGASPAPKPQAGALSNAVEPLVPRDHDERAFRFSLAGVQLKFSVVLADEKLTLPAHGALGGWLVKLDSRRFPELPENEHAVMRWAARAGFEVPEVRLFPSSALAENLGAHADEGTAAFAVRRFDRAGDERVHQEDFAQVVNLPPRHKYDLVTYEALVRLIAAITGEAGALEAMKRLVFMVASGNCDAHLKNWSLVYPDRVRPQLSPLYDQVATVAFPKVERRLALKFAGTRELGEIDRQTFARLARKAGLEESLALKSLDDALAAISAAAAPLFGDGEDALPEAHREAMRRHFQLTPLLRETELVRL